MMYVKKWKTDFVLILNAGGQSCFFYLLQLKGHAVIKICLQ